MVTLAVCFVTEARNLALDPSKTVALVVLGDVEHLLQERRRAARDGAAVLLDVLEVPVPAVAVRNINTPADLEPPAEEG